MYVSFAGRACISVKKVYMLNYVNRIIKIFSVTELALLCSFHLLYHLLIFEVLCLERDCVTGHVTTQAIEAKKPTC